MHGYPGRSRDGKVASEVNDIYFKTVMLKCLLKEEFL